MMCDAQEEKSRGVTGAGATVQASEPSTPEGKPFGVKTHGRTHTQQAKS